MTLTRDFKETIKARAKRDPEFRQALQDEAEQLLKAGDVDTAQAIHAKLIDGGRVRVGENSGFS